MQKTGLTLRAGATRACAEHDDSMRDAIGEDIEPRLRQLLKLDDVAPAARREE